MRKKILPPRSGFCIQFCVNKFLTVRMPGCCGHSCRQISRAVTVKKVTPPQPLNIQRQRSSKKKRKNLKHINNRYGRFVSKRSCKLPRNSQQLSAITEQPAANSYQKQVAASTYRYQGTASSSKLV